jgi:hypothetical protein
MYIQSIMAGVSKVHLSKRDESPALGLAGQYLDITLLDMDGNHVGSLTICAAGDRNLTIELHNLEAKGTPTE